ncbi:MAG: cytochrome c oxidase assembly factor Coa1 family protein [Rhodospirillales bacterium]
MSESTDNTSGQGKEAVLPDELKGWNWGALFLNVFWGIGNRTWIALLTLIPPLTLIMPFVLGARGNKWAWANRSWDDAEHFRGVQRTWGRIGAVFFIFFLVVTPLGVIAFIKNSQPYTMALDQTRGHPAAIEALGEPMAPGLMVMGSVKITRPAGNAEISFSVAGPKGRGEVFVHAVKEMGLWRLEQLLLDVSSTGKRLDITPSPTDLAGLTDAPAPEKPTPEPEKPAEAEKDPEKAAEAEAARKAEDKAKAIKQRIGKIRKTVLGGEAGEETAAAIRELFSLAQKGEAEAQVLHGDLHVEGFGVNQNNSLAWGWYKRAADAGDAEAQFKAGYMSQYGVGTILSPDDAIKYYTLAAEQGFAEAQIKLARDRRLKGGLNDAEMGQWLEKAAINGSVKAVKLLSVHARQGSGAAAKILGRLPVCARRLCQEPPSVGEADSGFAALLSNDIKSARAAFEPLAEKDDPGGLLGLGVMFLFGEGVPRDLGKAKELLQKAALKGLREARKMLGAAYLVDEEGAIPNYPQAVYWLGKASQDGDDEAQNMLGLMYLEGTGVGVNNAEALKWFKKSAQLGNLEASTSIGMMYAMGRGVKIDYQEAKKRFLTAAKGGSATAYNNLGIMYREGRDVSADNIEAHKWFTLAVKQGNEEAAEKRRVLAREMTKEQIIKAEWRALKEKVPNSWLEILKEKDKEAAKAGDKTAAQDKES